MRFVHIIISLLYAIFLFGCQVNNATDTKFKEFIGLNIAQTNIQELGSCDSMEISNASIHDSLFFLFRIPPNSCSSCYYREISTMRDFFKDGDLPIIVTSFDNCRDFLVFGRNFSFNKKGLFNSSSLIKTLDEQNLPYYLLLDSLFTITEVFITKKDNHMSTIEFLSSHSFRTDETVNR
jgi:hypothetical protein